MKRLIYVAAIALAIILAGLWLSWGRRHKANIITTELTADTPPHEMMFSNPATILSDAEMQRNRSSLPSGTESTSKSRHLFKTTNYPPQTVEEKEQWDWWQAMQKIDPKFEWKMPIEFYGKVVDQFNQPVDGAEVALNWTTVIGSIPDPQKTINADSGGRFTINSIQGKRLWISVNQKGYLPAKDAIASFEFAAFYDVSFYVPDPANPVVFHLHKLLGAEPMYQFEIDSRMAIDGTELVLDIIRGKVGTTGDFAFSVQPTDSHNEKGPSYTVTLRGLQGAEFASITDPFPFNPPESGYERQLTISEAPSKPAYSLTHKFQFYARTRDGKYGVVWAEISVSRFGNEVNFNSTVRYNPSGSRNLEFDQDKWINK